MVQNGSRWCKMVINGKNCQKMVKNCQKWSKWSKMVQNGPKWSKMVQMVENGRKWSKRSKMVKNGGHDLKRAQRTGLSARGARRTKSTGPKGLQLEVGARMAPRLLVLHILMGTGHPFAVLCGKWIICLAKFKIS